jgi:LysR family hydrogen peroxide-inducible transcriptional activator
MTIQQMEYIVALDKHRQFVKAAKACGVSQSTLSMMIKKLEEELDTIIFDREARPMKPTAAGEKIISQAKVVLFHAEQLKEITISERLQAGGDVHLAIIPTVATDIIPKMIKNMRRDNPKIHLYAYEMMTCDILDKLSKAELDIAIMATPLNNSNFLEIPVYYEKFFAYVSPHDALYENSELLSNSLPLERMWMLTEGNCMRDQVFRLGRAKSNYTAKYEAGSIDTLIRIVDLNGGFTVIPELHLPYLSEEGRKNVRPLVSPEAVREISLVIRKDFVRERILNEVANAVKKSIPEHMIDPGLKKFAIKI